MDNYNLIEIAKEYGLSRRDFLKILGALSATTLLTTSCTSEGNIESTITPDLREVEITPTEVEITPTTTEITPTEVDVVPVEGEITPDMIKSAEKIIGIELSDDERMMIVDSLKEEYLKQYLNLRDLEIDDTVVPAMVFNPIVPGMEFSREKKPFKYSNIRVSMPNSVEETAFYTVPQLAYLIRTRQVTSTELTEMYLDRLKRYDPTLLFAVTITEDLALEQAAKVDEEIQAGNYRGPLHGIPYGIKDLFSVKGYPTTWGAKPYKDRIIDRDASVVERLQEAGAVLVTKLATGLLASGDSWYRGLTRCPWNPEWGAGGSSAGPGSATAAGCVGFSIGTETSGSMISPCDANGVTGLRPTFGRVSRYGAMTTGWSWDKVAPMCRSVEGCAIVFNAIYGPDGRDNTIIDLPFNWDPDFDIRNLKIGYRTLFFEGDLMPGDYSYRKNVRELNLHVLNFFRDSGFGLLPLEFELGVNMFQPYSKAVGNMMMAENGAANSDRFLSGEYALFDDDETNWPRYWRESRFMPAVEYMQASRARSIYMQKFNEYMQDVDVYIEITWTSQWDTNVCGHPMMVLPCGMLDMGRPASIAFVGKLFGEAELLSVAKYYQDATKHHLNYPPLFDVG